MTLYTTQTDEKSRWYVSNVKEDTIGTAKTRDRSFYSINNSVNQKATDVPRKGVTGYLSPIGNVRVNKYSGGVITDNMYPAIVNWLCKFVFNGSATTAAVSPSTTAYSHTWNTITLPPATFSMTRKHGDSLAIETLCGLCISQVKFKSTEGEGSIEITVDGTGQGYDPAASEPSVTPALGLDNVPMVGVMTQLLVDDVAVSKGLFLSTWEVTIKTGYGATPSGGSADGAKTRIDKVGPWEVTASFTLYPTDNTLMTEFVAKTVHDYKLQFIGETIDAGNSITSLVQIQIPSGQAINEIKWDQGQGKVKAIPLQIRGHIELDAGTAQGFAVVIKTQDLQTAAQI